MSDAKQLTKEEQQLMSNLINILAHKNSKDKYTYNKYITDTPHRRAQNF